MVYFFLTYICLISLFIILHPINIILAKYIAKKETGHYPEFDSFTIIIPLAPKEHHIIKNIKSIFNQKFNGIYEIIFVAEEPSHLTSKRVTAMLNKYPQINARLIHSGKAENSIAKMHNLARAVREKLNDIVIFIDSDVQLNTENSIHEITRPLNDADIGLVTAAPQYHRANTLGGFLVSTMINADLWGYFAALFVWMRLNVANGAIMAMRREILIEIGKLRDFENQLLNDTAIAKRIILLGKKVFLAPIPAHIVTPPLTLSDWWNQAMRWHVGMRSVLPRYEYILYGVIRASMLTGLIYFLLAPQTFFSFAILLTPIVSRFFSTGIIQSFPGHTSRNVMELFIVLITDLISPYIWILSWFKNTITWHHRTYHLDKQGCVKQINR